MKRRLSVFQASGPLTNGNGLNIDYKEDKNDSEYDGITFEARNGYEEYHKMEQLSISTEEESGKLSSDDPSL